MNEIIYEKTYTEFREELKAELNKSAESFVKIGYLLKVARDTEILKTSGYSGLEDFARGEFDLEKTQVSRFIRINDRFSLYGNSDKLQDDYSNFGVRKLGLMLTLPDEINEELSSDYTVSEIESIKKTYDEEQKITPLENALEQIEAEPEISESNILFTSLYKISYDSPETFAEMFSLRRRRESIIEALAPAGEASHKLRIRGHGALLLSCTEKSINITNMRSLEKEFYSWDDANAYFDELISNTQNMTYKEAWSEIYGEEYKEKAEVAPVQQKTKVIDHIEKPKKEKIANGEKKSDAAGSGTGSNDKEIERGTERGKEIKEESSEIPERAEEVKEEEVPKEPQVAAVIKSEVIDECENKSKEAVFENIVNSHLKARTLADYIAGTVLSYETGELCASDIREALERLKTLQMHLEFMVKGFDEYESMM